MFFPYWLLIRPVSGLLRRFFLGTIDGTASMITKHGTLLDLRALRSKLAKYGVFDPIETS
jgi:hypothetical protein